MYTCSTVFTPFYTKHLKIKLFKKINNTMLQITGIDTLWVCKKVIIFMEVYKEKNVTFHFNFYVSFINTCISKYFR